MAAPMSPTPPRGVDQGAIYFKSRGQTMIREGHSTGQRYRVILAIDYERQLGFVRFVGTHAQYDQINAETV